jgi:hypothetical protein
MHELTVVVSWRQEAIKLSLSGHVAVLRVSILCTAFSIITMRANARSRDSTPRSTTAPDSDDTEFDYESESDQENDPQNTPVRHQETDTGKENLKDFLDFLEINSGAQFDAIYELERFQKQRQISTRSLATFLKFDPAVCLSSTGETGNYSDTLRCLRPCYNDLFIFIITKYVEHILRVTITNHCS